VILRHHAPADLPPDIAPVADAAGLSAADRSFLVVMSRVMGAERFSAYTEMVRNAPTDPTDDEFDALPADADEQVREDLAERMLPHVRRVWGGSPVLTAPDTRAPRGARFAGETALAAVQELYNPAQRDVIRRISALMAEDE
jgi:hypothetical protein